MSAFTVVKPFRIRPVVYMLWIVRVQCTTHDQTRILKIPDEAIQTSGYCVLARVKVVKEKPRVPNYV